MASAPKGANLIRFPPFALDPQNARLYRGDEVIPLRGKTLAVLEYLVARPGLVGGVDELRQIFGDTRRAARFVETVYRRGYRWIAAGAEAGNGEGVRRSAPGEAPQPIAHLALRDRPV